MQEERAGSVGQSSDMRKGYVISDLHMFTRRTEFARHLPTLRAVLEHTDHLVLNGDIFDFRWSTLPSHRATIDAALRWLAQLAADFPQCTVHFVAGNHDCSLEFLKDLAGLAQSTPNLQWHEHLLRLGEHVFLHGDAAATGRPAALDRYRESFRHEHHRPSWAHRVYDLFVAMRLHKVIAYLHSRRFAAKGLMAYLERVAPQDLEACQHIYSGHTHGPFSEYPHAGKSFHNTGSMVRGLKWNPIIFEWIEPGIDKP